MRTHVDLDEVLIDEAMALGGFPSKKAAIHAALADYVKTMKRQKLLSLRGKVAWQGDLAQLRQDRAPRSGRRG